MSSNTLPFPLYTPKGPQIKISTDFTGLENQIPDKKGGLVSSTPERHLMKCNETVEADAGEGLRR